GTGRRGRNLMGIFDRFRRKNKTEEAKPASLESQTDMLDDGLISLDEFEEWEQEQLSYKFEQGLKKSRDKFQQNIKALMACYSNDDEDFFESLEEVLISVDVGFNTVMELTEELRKEAQLKNITETSDLKETIVEKMVEIYERNGDLSDEMTINSDGLTVVLMVGVNGVGKTTSIGKLAHK